MSDRHTRAVLALLRVAVAAVLVVLLIPIEIAARVQRWRRRRG